MAKIYASIMEPTTEGVYKGLDLSKEQGADKAEVRVDALDVFSIGMLEKILEHARKIKIPVLITARHSSQAGPDHPGFQGTESEREETLKYALRNGADIDIEARITESEKEDKTRITYFLDLKEAESLTGEINISDHNFDSCLNARKAYNDVRALLRDSEQAVIKYVGTSIDISDCLSLMRLVYSASEQGDKVVCFSMKDQWNFTRILSMAYGAHHTFAAADPEKAAASGQLTISETRRKIQRAQGLRERGIILPPTSITSVRLGAYKEAIA